MNLLLNCFDLNDTEGLVFNMLAHNVIASMKTCYISSQIMMTPSYNVPDFAVLKNILIFQRLYKVFAFRIL